MIDIQLRLSISTQFGCRSRRFDQLSSNQTHSLWVHLFTYLFILLVHIKVMIPAYPMDAGGNAILLTAETLATNQVACPDLVHLAVKCYWIVIESLDINGTNALRTWRWFFANT